MYLPKTLDTAVFFFFFKNQYYRLELGANEIYLKKKQKKQHSITVTGPHASIEHKSIYRSKKGN